MNLLVHDRKGTDKQQQRQVFVSSSVCRCVFLPVHFDHTDTTTSQLVEIQRKYATRAKIKTIEFAWQKILSGKKSQYQLEE